jgi:hypothetical protein
MVDGKPKPLVRGGDEGMEQFKKVFISQLGLVEAGMLSGECLCTACLRMAPATAVVSCSDCCSQYNMAA